MASEPRMFFSWDDIETRPELQRLELSFDTRPDDAVAEPLLAARLQSLRCTGTDQFPH